MAVTSSQTAAQLPVTIEAAKDVPARLDDGGTGQRGILYISGGPFVIKKGQRFQMVGIYPEGRCRILLEKKEYYVSSCPWLDGFADHQADIFRIIPAAFDKPSAFYISPKYVAPANAPSAIVVAGSEEPGQRLIVTGQVTDGIKPLAGASIYVFQTDAKGRYTTDGGNGDENARLHGAMRSDANGRYRYDTIRPGNDPGGTSPAHVHYVVRAAGYKPRLFEIWFEDDPVLAAFRKAGLPDVPASYPPWAVEIRPVTRDADGAWHSTRDLTMVRE
jgi:protocatechuate 3,4-dioxygenase beta subunit